MKRFVFLDRDGTLIKLYDYLSDPELVELLPAVPQGLRLLADAGLGLAITTNQSGVGRGYYTLSDMHKCNRRTVKLLADQGVVIDAVYYCPHAPDAGCDCRKPLPGMIRQAQRDFNLDPARSFVIGDNEPDVELARSVGAASVLVTTGHFQKEKTKLTRPADHVAADMLEAARWIIDRL